MIWRVTGVSKFQTQFFTGFIYRYTTAAERPVVIDEMLMQVCFEFKAVLQPGQRDAHPFHHIDNCSASYLCGHGTGATHYTGVKLHTLSWIWAMTLSSRATLTRLKATPARF